MWTEDHRKTHKPRKGRYASDVSDEEWAVIAPMIPPARAGGRNRVANGGSAVECRTSKSNVERWRNPDW